VKVAVWDNYVRGTSGTIMHFDILVPAELMQKEVIYNYGQKYLTEKGQHGQRLDTNECKFCHIEEATPEMLDSINTKGFHIIEMEGCN
jgi:hypothetical protein